MNEHFPDDLFIKHSNTKIKKGTIHNLKNCIKSL